MIVEITDAKEKQAIARKVLEALFTSAAALRNLKCFRSFGMKPISARFM